MARGRPSKLGRTSPPISFRVSLDAYDEIAAAALRAGLSINEMARRRTVRDTAADVARASEETSRSTSAQQPGKSRDLTVEYDV